MVNKITDIITDEQKTPREQDRFSFVFQAHYQQWNSDTLTCNAKGSRLVDEPKEPKKLSLDLPLGKETILTFKLDGNSELTNFDLVLVNVTGKDLQSRRVAEEAKSSYIEVLDTNGRQIDIIRPGKMRLTNIAPESISVTLRAVGISSKVTVFAFPE